MSICFCKRPSPAIGTLIDKRSFMFAIAFAQIPIVVKSRLAHDILSLTRLQPATTSHKASHRQNLVRNTVNFSPSIWGDQFLIYNERKDIACEEQLARELKEKVRKELLVEGSTGPTQHMKLLELIDVVQRLGVAYHFEDEIEECLKHIYVTYGDKWINENNLESTSLWFRLLRQQGFNVSSGIFYKYKNENGNFLESLRDDIHGMLSLYEATYMRVEGEEVLDEALEFTKYHLGNIIQKHICSNDAFLETQIYQALRQPLRKRLPRLEALRYIPIYQQQDSRNDDLLTLAKLDFNLLQELHRKELSQISKWWKNLDVMNKVPYARDRIVEGYFWILAVYFEPQHSESRIFLMKICNLLVILDDTYDNYGTYEELQIFTKAIQKWSISCMDMLPEYMKLIYQEILNVYKEAEDLLEKKGNTYRLCYTKEMVKEYTQNLLIEAKWVNERYIPTFEEYMSVAIVSIGYPLLIMLSYVHRDDLVTEDTFKWLSNYPPIVKASSLIFRLMDDTAMRKDEQERNHVASSVECYMKEHEVSKEHTHELFSKLIEDNWKVINKESLRPTHIPEPLLMSPINFVRVCEILYTGGDNYTHAGKEMIGYIKSLLVTPITV
ncbi:putative beta-farnesene synthase [Helianthus debilis subsp. tardiflorus]